MKEMKEFNELWSQLKEVPVNNEDELESDFLHFELESDFLHFEAGSDKFEVWAWFEETFDITLGEIL